MDALVTLPVTCQRSVDDWPRWTEVGSALKVIEGAAGLGCSVVGAGGGGGGGAGAGTFFLQPAANIASTTAKQMIENFLLLNINIAS
jgi:hypothetical protein